MNRAERAVANQAAARSLRLKVRLNVDYVSAEKFAHIRKWDTATDVEKFLEMLDTLKSGTSFSGTEAWRQFSSGVGYPIVLEVLRVLWFHGHLLRDDVTKRSGFKYIIP